MSQGFNAPLRRECSTIIPWEDERAQFLRVVSNNDDDRNKLTTYLSSPEIDAQSLNDMGLLCDPDSRKLSKETQKAMKDASWSRRLWLRFQAVAFYLSRGGNVTDEVTAESITSSNLLPDDAFSLLWPQQQAHQEHLAPLQLAHQRSQRKCVVTANTLFLTSLPTTVIMKTTKNGKKR